MELKIKKETAKKIYAESPDSLKEILIETFGKECFEKRDWRDIKTFEDACKELGITNEACRPIFDEEEDPDEIAYKKLKVIAKAINQGWTPDWHNTNQYKWHPWFNLSSGFGFSTSDYDCTGTGTDVGSRLCTDSSEKAMYIAEQFKAEYQEYFLYS